MPSLGARLVLVLRQQDGSDWRLPVPCGLEACIGHYARIPELAQIGPLLRIDERDAGSGC